MTKDNGTKARWKEWLIEKARDHLFEVIVSLVSASGLYYLWSYLAMFPETAAGVNPDLRLDFGDQWLCALLVAVIVSTVVAVLWKPKVVTCIGLVLAFLFYISFFPLGIWNMYTSMVWATHFFWAFVGISVGGLITWGVRFIVRNKNNLIG